VIQKTGHPRNSMGVRFFGPPCMVSSAMLLFSLFLLISLYDE